MPSSVRMTDVALRDGLQNHPAGVPTPTKLSVLDGLLAAGLRSVEVGSFVHPRCGNSVLVPL
jgi:hydroxymethylglutaryl-CoA lyase